MLQSYIASLRIGNESMAILDRKLLLLRNMLDRTVASCQVELQEAGADCSFWHISCYVFESPPFLKSAKVTFSGRNKVMYSFWNDLLQNGQLEVSWELSITWSIQSSILVYSDPLRVVSWRNRCVFL